MRPSRAGEDRDEGQRHPTGLDTEDQQRAAHRLGREHTIGEPAGQADRGKELGGARQREHDELQDEAVGEKHEAQGNTQQRDRVWRELGIDRHGRLLDATALICTCICIQRQS